jgi:hypothetical protein
LPKEEVEVAELPDTNPWQPLHEQQEKVEECAGSIRALINECDSLKRSYKITDMIAGMRKVYGPTSQVCGAISSLHLDLFHKQDELINKMYGGSGTGSRW